MSKIEYTDDKYINVESLMCGDLVVMKGHIVRVSGITGGCLRCATGNRIDDNETVISSLVERIPLSLELLNKMFPWRGTHYAVKGNNFYLTIEEYTQDKWKVEIVKHYKAKYGELYDRIELHIQYLHQLQQIIDLFDLNLCLIYEQKTEKETDSIQ